MRSASRILALVALIAAAAGCGDVVRQGRSPSVLVINSLLAAPTGGFGANTFSNTLFSDVQVLLRSPDPCTAASPCPTVYSDLGQATVSLAMKDTTVAPTSNNQVTITRYTVNFRRNDGRNTPGVDVPYPIDGAVTATVPAGGQTSFSYEMVRHVAKEEPPLVQLIVNRNIIATTAEITFYGKDLVGNAVTASGSMRVEFGNFGDQ